MKCFTHSLPNMQVLILACFIGLIKATAFYNVCDCKCFSRKMPLKFMYNSIDIIMHAFRSRLDHVKWLNPWLLKPKDTTPAPSPAMKLSMWFHHHMRCIHVHVQKLAYTTILTYHNFCVWRTATLYNVRILSRVNFDRFCQLSKVSV